MCPAASRSSANPGSKRCRKDATWPDAGKEAGIVSHPVPRVLARAGGGQDKETCSIGTRRNADGCRARPAARGQVSSTVFDQRTRGMEKSFSRFVVFWPCQICSTRLLKQQTVSYIYTVVQKTVTLFHFTVVSINADQFLLY